MRTGSCTKHVVGGGCQERKGAATGVASPFSSPATPLSRAAPPRPQKGGRGVQNELDRSGSRVQPARCPRILDCVVQCYFVAGHILSGVAGSSFC